MVSNRASRYRHTVDLLAGTVSRGDDGAPVTLWGMVAAFRADIMPSGGSETSGNGKLNAENTYTVAIRYRSGVTITPAMRLRFIATGKVFEIISVKADDTFRKDYVLSVAEVVL